MALHIILQHLYSSGTYARILFVDFSSAINTIILSLLQINKEQEIEKSIQVVTRVVSVIEKNQASLIAEIERKQEAADATEARLRQELGQEIVELQRRQSELQLLDHTDDNLHLLQVRKVTHTSTIIHT